MPKPFNNDELKVINRYYVQTYVRIHLNSDANSTWQFYDTLDPNSLISHYSKRESIVIFRPEDGGPSEFNDFPLVEDGAGYLKTGAPMTLELNKSYYVDVFDYQGRQWRVGSSNIPPGQYLMTATQNGTVTTTTSYQELDGNTVYKTTTYTIDPNQPLLLEIYPEPDPPTLADFTALTLDLNYDQVIDDASNSAGWASAYNAGNTYWVNGTQWGVQWVNVQTGINGSILHPSINLYWCVTDPNEISLSAQQIYERSQKIPAGKGDYRTYISSGNIYSPNPGAELNGYIEIDLKGSYCPQGVYTPNTFQGKGKLHLAMGMDGVDYSNWKTVAIDILHEPEVASGNISVSLLESSSRTARLQISGFISNPQNAISPISTRYRVDAGNWVETGGYASTLEVGGLTPNNTHAVDVEVRYMNQTVNTSTYLINAQTTPGIDDLSFTLTPKPQPSGETLYDLTLTIQDSNAGTVEYAFLRDDIQRDYRGLDLSSLSSIAYFINYQASTTYTYTDLKESDIEGYYWVALVRDTINTDNLSWSSLYMTQQTITGLTSASPVTSDGVDITIPKEHSNRYVKDILINRVEAGLLEFGSSQTISRSYSTGERLVHSVALEVEDFIPAAFSGDRETYIQYAIIIGGQRYPITPLNRNGSNPIIYHINLSVPEDERRLRRAVREEFIDTKQSVTSFQVEARISGRPEMPYLTPVVFNWRVRVVVNPRSGLYLGDDLASQIQQSGSTS